MKQVLYKQVKLEAKGGTLQYQCWLPTRFAKQGKRVRITDYPHTLWNIAEVYTMVLTEDHLRDLGEEHRYHRRVTDI